MEQHDALRLILTSSLNDRDIAAAVGLSKTTIGRYRQMARLKRWRWEEVRHRSPAEVRELLCKPRSGGKPKTLPDLERLHRELQTKGTTLQLLWEEYRRENPDTCPSYSHLAAKLNAFRGSLSPSMRQNHTPGERACVDYSGDLAHYFDPKTGQRIEAQVFVAVLDASSLIFATCTPSQQVPDFLKAHVAMFDYFGGVPHVVVPDNLKSAVSKPARAGEEAVLQRGYADLGRHYQVAILPARPRRPTDKPTVEVSVKLVQQRILAPLRHQRFYSLAELNAAVAVLLDELNRRPMDKCGVSRRDRFEAFEREALFPLPEQPYEYAQWQAIPRVPKDYYVPIQGHFYSVPHALIGQRVEARITHDRVELFHDNRRVATHARSAERGRHTTDPAHQTDAHRAQSQRNPDGMRRWAKDAGRHIHQFVQEQLGGARPFLGMPACDALRILAHRHGTAVVDQVVGEAQAMQSPSLTTIRRLLDNRQTGLAPKTQRASHARGASYYARGPSSC